MTPHCSPRVQAIESEVDLDRGSRRIGPCSSSFLLADSSNKCIAISNKCLTSSNKKLLETIS